MTTWHEKIIEKPTVLLRTGPWVLRGYPWLIFAHKGETAGFRSLEDVAPARSAADTRLALEAPLVGQRELSALLDEMGTAAVIAEAAGRYYNASALVDDKRSGFKPALEEIAEAYRDRGERPPAVGFCRVPHTSKEGYSGEILVIGTEDWRLLVMSLREGALYRFDLPGDPDQVAQLAHALGVIPDRAPEEWDRLLKRVQRQTSALRRLRGGLVEVCGAAEDLLAISPESEDPLLTTQGEALTRATKDRDIALKEATEAETAARELAVERDEARREATEIAATLADVAKAKVAAEEALAAAEQVQCDLARERDALRVELVGWQKEALYARAKLRVFPAPGPTWEERDARLSAAVAAGPVDWSAVRAAVGRLYWAGQGCTKEGEHVRNAIGRLEALAQDRLVLGQPQPDTQQRLQELARAVQRQASAAPLLAPHINDVCKLLGVHVRGEE